MHATVWHTPQPLWPKALADPAPYDRFRRPAVLRFASDAFMDEVQAQLAADPAGIDGLVATAETWRATTAGWGALGAEAAPVKLYQPVHQRYYMVAASLVCQRRGLPERRVAVAEQESTAFVLRRLPLGPDGAPRPEDDPGYIEHGWFGDAGWRPVDGPGGLDRIGDASAGGDGAPVIEREERHPLFPLSFDDAATGHTRRLHAGLVPVGARERLETAPRADAPAIPPGDLAGDSLADPRLGQYERAVVGLLAVRDAITEDLARPVADRQLDANEVHEPFAFGLLDLVVFVSIYLGDVWARVEVGSPGALVGDEREVYDALNALDASGGTTNPGVSFALLRAILAHRDAFERGAIDIGSLPADLAPLGSRTLAQMQAAVDAGHLDIRPATIGAGLDYANGGLNPAVLGALGAFLGGTDPTAGGYLPEEPGQTPEATQTVGGDTGAVYAVRFVYERPRCRRPGPTALVSARSRPFRLAGFFDPDAPVRPTRIALPVDTSLSGLRSFPKAVSFLISDQLRAQLDRVNGVDLEALNDGEIGDEGGWTLGMICSLSIPIITICAFILLLIIVFLLNIVFWWVPFFRICFPIPVKK